MVRSSKIITIVAMAGFALAGLTNPASAAIPYALRSTLMHEYSFKRPRDFSKGIDISNIKPVESSRATKPEDVSKIIPSDMKPTSDGGMVAAQILDHSLSNWFNSEAVRNSDLGRTAHQVEKSMEGDVSFGGGQPDSIKHNFRFAMRAAQTHAQIGYTGLTNAQVTYYMLQNKTDFEVREAVKPLGTQLVYNEIVTREDTRRTVSLRWDW